MMGYFNSGGLPGETPAYSPKKIKKAETEKIAAKKKLRKATAKKEAKKIAAELEKKKDNENRKSRDRKERGLKLRYKNAVKKWLKNRGHRELVLEHDTLPQMIAGLFHHIHHNGAEHTVHHCDGKGEYKIKHCKCGLHTIDKRFVTIAALDSGHQLSRFNEGFFDACEVGLMFTDKCSQQRYHIESAVVMKNSYFVERHPAHDIDYDKKPIEKVGAGSSRESCSTGRSTGMGRISGSPRARRGDS